MQTQLEFLTRPTIRHRHLLDAIGPVRDLMRNEFPTGGQGMVIEDLDMIMRVYGHEFGTDQKGRFAMLEFKLGMREMDDAQRNSFSLIDESVRTGCNADRYEGFWLINFTTDDRGDVRFLRARLKFMPGHSAELADHRSIYEMLRSFKFPEPVDLWDAA